MALKIHNVTVDCAKPRELAQFWAAALDYQLAEWSDADGAAVSDPAGQGVRMLFMPVPEAKIVKNRFHLDITPSETRQAEVARLQSLGAQVVKEYDETTGPWTGKWTVMTDPEGNEFCVEPGPQDEE
jgi:predicted enzyme related to lactoylglutathione lyase